MSVYIPMDVPASAFIQQLTGNEEETTSQMSSKHGSSGKWFTRTLPKVDPLMGKEAGAADEALPIVQGTCTYERVVKSLLSQLLLPKHPEPFVWVSMFPFPTCPCVPHI